MADIRTLSTKLVLDSSKFSVGIKDAQGNLVSLERTSKNVALGLGALSAAGIAAISGIGLISKKALDEYIPFESALVDLGKVGVSNINRVRDEILNLPPALGKATDLTKGYYQTISAGVTQPKKALELLTTAAQTANSAHVNQSEVIKGLTKVMAGYEGQVASAAEASDLLFTIEKLGQTSVSELIPVIGGLASVSNTLNVSQDELGASLAQISQFAGSTTEASTQYQAILTGLMKPTEQMSDLLDKYGGAQKAIKDLGFSKVLQLIAEDTKGSAEALGELFGRKEAILGFLALSKEGFTGLNEKIDAMGEKTGAADKAYQEWAQSSEGLRSALSTNLNEVALIMGENLTPAFNAVISLTNEWFASNQDLIQNSISKIPVIINDYVLPGILGMLNAMNEVKTGFSLAWDSINMLVIDGMKLIGNFTNLFRDEKVNYDQIAEEMKQKHIESMDATYKSSQEFTTNLEGLQDTLLSKINVTQKERQDIVVKTNAKILENTTNTSEKLKTLTEEEIEKLKKKQDIIDKNLKDREKAVDQFYSSYEGYSQEWYDNEIDRIMEQKQKFEDAGVSNVDLKKWETQQLNKLHEDSNKRKQQSDTNYFDFARHKSEENHRYWTDIQGRKHDAVMKFHEMQTTMTGAGVDAFIAGEDVKQSVAKASADLMVEWTSSFSKKMFNAAIEEIIGLIGAELGLGAAASGGEGATEGGVWGALAHIGIYLSAGIGAMLAARGMKDKFRAEGGWIGNHPNGGMISGGSGTRDDVYLGQTGNTRHWGMGGEFVINRDSTAKHRGLIEMINADHANGGPVKDWKPVADQLAIGGAGSAIHGFLKGGPWGALAELITYFVTAIPSMFGGKLLAKAFKKDGGEVVDVAHGFGDFVKDIIDVDPMDPDPFDWFGIKDPFERERAKVLGKDWIYRNVQSKKRRLDRYSDPNKMWDFIKEKIRAPLEQTSKDLVTPGVYHPRPIAEIKTILKYVEDDIKDAFSWILPEFENGGIVSETGFAKVDEGEVITPAGRIPFNENDKLAMNGVTIENVNFNLYGIDRNNARDITRNYIIPELKSFGAKYSKPFISGGR